MHFRGPLRGLQKALQALGGGRKLKKLVALGARHLKKFCAPWYQHCQALLTLLGDVPLSAPSTPWIRNNYFPLASSSPLLGTFSFAPSRSSFSNPGSSGGRWTDGSGNPHTNLLPEVITLVGLMVGAALTPPVLLYGHAKTSHWGQAFHPPWIRVTSKQSCWQRAGSEQRNWTCYFYL